MSNFTVEQTSHMLDTYNASKEADYATRTAVVKSLAEEFKVTENRVRGKLVSEKVYLPKSNLTSQGEVKRKANKEDVINAMQDVYGVKIPSFKNASLRDLTAFWEAIVRVSQSINAEMGVKE